MLPILAATIVFVMFGVGDMIATRTKAIVSMLFFASVAFLLGFWSGILPTTLFADSTILSVAGICVAMLLVHLGTIIKLSDFISQWKTVIVAAAACIGISLGIFFIGQFIIDRAYALVGAPILSGGVVATLIMSQMATDAGLPDLAVFATLVMVSQGFVGYPVASLCLRSEAKRLKKLMDEGKADLTAGEKAIVAENNRKKLIPKIPSKYNGPNVIIARVAFVAFLGTIVARWINSYSTTGRDIISHLVICLILGVLAKEIGLLDEDSLTNAKATGFIMPVITLSIFTNLATATPQMVVSMLWPLIVVIIIGSICFMGISVLVGKIFKYSWQMSMAIGSTCLYGFPGTYIVTTEVVNSTATNDKEKQYMMDSIMPKMLIAGMVTVSITSILIAGVMSGWL